MTGLLIRTRSPQQSVVRTKLVIKGIMDSHAAQTAVDVGADGIIVSNHGGPKASRVALAGMAGAAKAIHAWTFTTPG